MADDVDWDSAISATSFKSIPFQLAQELLSAAESAEMPPILIARLAAMAADAGSLEAAKETMSRLLSGSPAAGWFRYYDGGSRINLWTEATSTGNEALRALAAVDFAKSMTRGALRSPISPGDLRAVLECLAGSSAVGSLWNEVDAALDRYAPSSEENEEQKLVLPVAETHDQSLLRWIRSLLAHPVRNIDFGARRTLMSARIEIPDVVDDLLAEDDSSDCWRVEAWLHSYFLDRELHSVSTSMQERLRHLAGSNDAILRFMAVDICARLNLVPELAAARALPRVYSLDLPPAPDHRYPELDAEGIPHIDYTDPRQVIAPFDVLVESVKTNSGISSDTLLYRAAALGSDAAGYWISDGHREHADRLKRRGSKFAYRPWAFMVGRRAAGLLLAELDDADETDAFAIIESTGMIDRYLTAMPVSPLDESISLPWRPSDVKSYDFGSWCDDAPRAAASVAKNISGSPEYVLGETSHWGAMDWAVPEERRRLTAARPTVSSSKFWTPPSVPKAIQCLSASVYPHIHQRLSERGALLVAGWDLTADSPWGEWLAINPNTAIELGWELSKSDPFEWLGPDGSWRARSLLQVRGTFRQGPSAVNEDSARMWRVVLSPDGLDELVRRFGRPNRRVEITRTTREKRKDNIPARSNIASVTLD